MHDSMLGWLTPLLNPDEAMQRAHLLHPRCACIGQGDLVLGLRHSCLLLCSFQHPLTTNTLT